MDFLEVIKQARDVPKSKGRIADRTLKRQFAPGNEALENRKFERIIGQELAIDTDDEVLVRVAAALRPR